MRAAVPALLLLLLAACSRGGATDPFIESRTPPSMATRFLPPEGWAWGLLQVGDRPAQRYGVASPPRVPQAAVIILPGYGETAETWFETARQLVARGYTVWVLDRAGQGGSGRYTLPRDLGFVPSFAPDVAGLRAFVRTVVRPTTDLPVIVLAHADASIVALQAASAGLSVDGLIASSPPLLSRESSSSAVTRLFGRLPRPGWRAWSRDRPDDYASGQTHDPWRGGLTHRWMTANPDLRLTGQSLGWAAAYAEAKHASLSAAPSLSTPVVMIVAGDRRAACGALKRCRAFNISGARPALHLESDRWRDAWLSAVGGFIERQVVVRRGAAKVALSHK